MTNVIVEVTFEKSLPIQFRSNTTNEADALEKAKEWARSFAHVAGMQYVYGVGRQSSPVGATGESHVRT